MSVTRQIAHNTIVQIIGKLISTLLGLVAIGMMTRYLGQEQFGWYVTAIAFLQFVGILTDFGLTPVTAQMMSEQKFDQAQLFKNLLGFRVVSSAIFLGLAPLVALLFPYPKEIKIAISFTTISFLAIALNQVLIGLYQTKLKMHIQALGEILGRSALVIGLWLVIGRGVGFLPVMGIVVISSVSYTSILWLLAVKYIKPSLAFDWPIWKAILQKSWPIAIAIIFNVVYLKGDVILLSLFNSQANVGIYGAAYRVLDVLTQSAMMFMGVLLPLLAFAWSQNDKAEFRQRYQQAFDLMMLFALPMTMGTIALANPIMKFIAGEEFAHSGSMLAILALAVFGVFLGAVFGHTAVAIDKQKQTLWIYISNALITLLGYLVFIPRYGISGAAWMSVFSELYAGILLFFIVRHYCQEQLRFKTFGKIIFASLIMAGVIVFLQAVHVLVVFLVGIAVYCLALVALQAVSQKTLREILTI